VIPVAVGVDYVRLGAEARDLGFRAGIHERSRYLSSDGRADGIAAQVALLPTLWAGERGGPRWPRSYVALGPVLDAACLLVNDRTPLGQLGLGVTLEWYSLGSTFLP
jgi:hypothetical protein